jgi:hypothetical protein
MAKKIHKNVRALEPLDAVNKFLNLIGEENPADCFCGRKGIKKVRKNNKQSRPISCGVSSLSEDSTAAISTDHTNE